VAKQVAEITCGVEGVVPIRGSKYNTLEERSQVNFFMTKPFLIQINDLAYKKNVARRTRLRNILHSC
jgi:hypothetical protein